MIRTWKLLTAFVPLLLACSGAHVTTDATAASDAGTEAGPGESACPEGTHPTAEGTCDAELEWQNAGTIAPARNHHVTFAATSAAGTFLYVGGGMGDMATSPVPLYDDMQMSAIAADGSLGPWRTTTPLPRKAAGQGIAVLGDVVVLTGGMLERGLSKDTLASRIRADGSLGPWTPAPSIPAGRYHHTTATFGRWIYLVGGLAKSSLADTARATVGEDGTVSGWTAMTALPAPRSHHASLVHDGALYVFGGADVGTSDFYTDVLRAPIAEDGTLGQWSKVADLPENGGALSVIELGGFVYAFGGVKGSRAGLEVISTVRRAAFQPDGSLGSWEDAAKLPTARGHVHQTPLVGGHVFSIGGAKDDGSAMGDVLVGTFR